MISVEMVSYSLDLNGTISRNCKVGIKESLTNKDVRPYCYQILLSFVIVHAQVCEISTSIVRRVIRELLSVLVQDLLNCHRRVDGFSLGGMLQVRHCRNHSCSYIKATLETEFLHQSLKSYETPLISSSIKLIYDTLEHGRIKSTQDSANAMSEMLQKVKVLIGNARKSTGAQFLCFVEG